jgi:hypothetical protein
VQEGKGGGVLRVLAGQVLSLDGGVMGCWRPIQSAYWPPTSEYAATGGAAAAAASAGLLYGRVSLRISGYLPKFLGKRHIQSQIRYPLAGIRWHWRISARG